MFSLPPLLEEDIQCMESALDELLQKSEATAALIIDKGGPLITQRGSVKTFDTTTMAALTAGSFAASEAIASLIGESDFSSVYQQGERQSLWIGNVGSNLLVIVIFKASLGVGVVKYFAADTIQRIAAQIKRARLRTDENLDLVSLNLLDSSELFKKKA